MLELNKVMLVGRLTRDPEVSSVGSGTALAKLGIAVNRRWKDKSGEYQEEVSFIDVTAWGKTADFCGAYLTKGKGVYVEGRLKMDAWEASDGTKRNKLTVTAERVQFAESRAESDAQGGATGATQPSAAAPRPATQGAPKTDDDLPF